MWLVKVLDLVTFTEEILNGKLHFFVQCKLESLPSPRTKGKFIQWYVINVEVFV